MQPDRCFSKNTPRLNSRLLSSTINSDPSWSFADRKEDICPNLIGRATVAPAMACLTPDITESPAVVRWQWNAAGWVTLRPISEFRSLKLGIAYRAHIGFAAEAEARVTNCGGNVLANR